MPNVACRFALLMRAFFRACGCCSHGHGHGHHLRAQPRIGRQPLHEFQRLHEDVGGAVFSLRFEFEYHLLFAVYAQAFVADLRARDVTAQLF